MTQKTNPARLAIRGLIDKVKSLSIENQKNYKRFSINLENQNKEIELPVNLIPVDMVEQKNGEFHFSVTGKISKVDKNKVVVKIKDYSCSLQQEIKESDKALPG